MTTYLSLLSFVLSNTVKIALVAAVLLGFRVLERRGRREGVLVVVLGALLLDVGLYPTYGQTAGLLHPSGLGHSIDLTTVLGVLGLLVRSRRTSPGRLQLTAALWTVFLLWTASSAVHGLLSGHASKFVLYEAEVLLHVGVIAVLVAGVPVARLTAPSGLPALAWVFAPLSLLIAVAGVAKASLTFSLPLLHTVELGKMGGDAATVFSSLGAVCLVIAMTRPVGARASLLPAVVLLVSPLVAGQRAAVLGLGAALVVILVAFLTQGRARVLRVTSGEVLLASLLACSLVALVVVATSTTSSGSGDALSAQIHKTFSSTAKQQSAQSRRNQWSKAFVLVKNAPVTGNGLGTTYVYYEISQLRLVTSEVTHDIPLDVALRSGIIGVLLLLVATAGSVVDGARTFRSRASPQVRAVALGALGVFVGLVAKGTVESIFEKHRLAVLLGVSIGLLCAAVKERAEHDDEATKAYEGLDPARDMSADDRWGATAWT